MDGPQRRANTGRVASPQGHTHWHAGPPAPLLAHVPGLTMRKTPHLARWTAEHWPLHALRSRRVSDATHCRRSRTRHLQEDKHFCRISHRRSSVPEKPMSQSVVTLPCPGSRKPRTGGPRPKAVSVIIFTPCGSAQVSQILSNNNVLDMEEDTSC